MAKGFDKIRQGECTLHINRNFRNNNLEQALLAGEKELQQCYRLTAIRSSKFTRVYKFTAKFNDANPVRNSKEDKRVGQKAKISNGANRGVYFKQYLSRSVWDFIKHLFRTSRVRRAFNATMMLAENGFDAPSVIAIGEYKFNLLHTKDFLVTLGVENAKRVYQCLFDRLENLTKEQLRSKRKLIRAFGQIVGKAHARGIFHGDLRLGNVLARQENGGWQFFFLDNERTRRFHGLPFRLRLKNLVQVNMFPPAYISNTDRLRFFREYWTENEKGKSEEIALIKKILKKTNRRLSKKK